MPEFVRKTLGILGILAIVTLVTVPFTEPGLLSPSGVSPDREYMGIFFLIIWAAYFLVISFLLFQNGRPQKGNTGLCFLAWLVGITLLFWDKALSHLPPPAYDASQGAAFAVWCALLVMPVASLLDVLMPSWSPKDSGKR